MIQMPAIYRGFLYLTVFISTALFYYAFTWHAGLAGFMADDAVYLILADYFSPGAGGIPQDVARHVMNTYPYPPVYPALLGLLGSGSENIGIGHAITTSFLLATGVLLSLWVYAETGKPQFSILFYLSFLFLPFTLFHSLETWSEFTYLFFSVFACLAILKAREQAGWWYVTALCVAFASLTREIGMALIVAFAISAWYRKAPGRWQLVAISVFPALIWKLYKHAALDIKIRYAEGFGYLAGKDAFQVISTVRENLGRLYDAWTGMFSIFPPGMSIQIISATLIMVSIPVLVYRLRSVQFDAIYLLFYLGVVILWPYQDHYGRFLYGVAPLILMYALLGLTYAANRFIPYATGRFLPYLFFAAVAGMIAPSVLHISDRLHRPIDPEFAGMKNSRYWLRGLDDKAVYRDLGFRKKLTESTKDLGEQIAEGQCIYSAYPEFVTLHSGRKSILFPSEQFTDEQFFNRASECEYYYIVASPNPGFREPMYPMSRLQAHGYQLVTHSRTDEGIVTLLLKTNR